jgi:hypothetical protein
MAEALIVLIGCGVVFALGAAFEHATRPKVEMHADDQMAEGNARW